MRRVWILGLFTLLLFNSCSTTKSTPRQTKKTVVEHASSLVHIVFLKTKEDLTKEAYKELLEAVEAIEEIEVVEEFSMGTVADTQDSRFISNHNLVFQIVVKDLDAYQKYQNHPIHLKLKEIAKDKLTASPAVYDYWKK